MSTTPAALTTPTTFSGLVPPTSVNDDTEIEVACAFLASKLHRIAGIEAKTELYATLLLDKFIYDIGTLRAKGFTVTQIDMMLREAGLDGARATVERAWGVKFNPPAAPTDERNAIVTSSNHLRLSRFLDEGQPTIGNYLTAHGMIADVRLSPRLPDIIMNPHKLSVTDFWEAVKEEVVWTFKQYEYVCVDQAYLDLIVGKLEDEKGYPNIPNGLDWRRGLFNMFHKYCKSGAKPLATLPLIDLSGKCITIIKEKGYPIIIDEAAPSRYSKYQKETGQATTGTELGTSATELPAQTGKQPQERAIATESPAQTGGQQQERRVALGTVSTATSGFRLLPPKPPANSTATSCHPGNRRLLPPSPSPAIGAMETCSSDDDSDDNTPLAALIAKHKKKRRRGGGSAAARKKPTGAAPSRGAKKPKSGQPPASSGVPAIMDTVLTEPQATDPLVPAVVPGGPEVQVPAFEDVSDGRYSILNYDTALSVVGQKVANYDNGKWLVGTICSTTFRKRTWVEYPELPQVKSHKKVDKGKYINQELSHTLDPKEPGREYMTHWLFVKETTLPSDEL